MISKENLAFLCQLAKEAGEAVMGVYQQDFSAWDKEDASPLTEADLRSDQVIRSGLEARFPNVYILSEESKSGDALQSETSGLFLVDPLDGTKEFVKRNDEFTVNIAYIEDGRAVMSAVYAPALDELFYAAVGLGAWHQVGNAQPTSLLTRDLSQGATLQVIGSRSHGGEKLSNWLSSLTMPYEFLAAGSSLKLCRVAQGQAHIYPRFGPTSQWDTAAAQCVVEVAGGCVVTLDNTRLLYGLEREILNPEFLVLASEQLYQRLGFA